MTAIELEAKKMELFQLITTINTEDMLQEATVLLKRLVSKSNSIHETQEELRQSIFEAIDEFHQRKTVPHKLVKRKVL